MVLVLFIKYFLRYVKRNTMNNYCNKPEIEDVETNEVYEGDLDKLILLKNEEYESQLHYESKAFQLNSIYPNLWG